jgi:hypothetical protein
VTPLRVHNAASAEVAAAIRWYNEQQPGLGDDFRTDFIASVDRIIERPLAWPISPYDPRARRCLLTRFPYSLVYLVRPQSP